MRSSSFYHFLQKYWKPILILVLASALAYLPNITKLTLYKDDWYYIADGFFGGPKIFHDMFFVDRPLRGYLYEGLFSIFGTNPFPYQVLAYVWRLLGGLLYFWLLNLIWPKNTRLNTWIAVFFTLYPGYLWWVSGVEYQPYILAQCLQVFSFVMTVLFLRTTGWAKKILFFCCAAISGWTGYMLVDYTIGMELFRLVIVYLELKHRQPGGKSRGGLGTVIKKFIPLILIPLGFMVWRTFFFDNARPETDISLQLSQFKATPLAVGFIWLQKLIVSFFNVTVAGWIKPFLSHFESISFWQLMIACGLCLVVLFAARKLLHSADEPADAGDRWQSEALLGGAIGVIGGIIPIVVMNREVNIEYYSHYLLNILAASVPMLVAVLAYLRTSKIRETALQLILAFLIFSNYCYSVSIVKEESAIADFWQQVSLRVPRLKPDATLLVNLPESYEVDNWDAIWAPVNYLYAQPSEVVNTGGVIRYPFAGLQPAIETSKNILMNNEEGLVYRTHAFYTRYDQLLVISQPTADSCVHIIDSRWPRLSIADPDQVLLFAGDSKIDEIISPRTYVNYDEKIFGSLNEENWCSIYQKAELALQLEEWDQVAALQAEAASKNLQPKDQVEWLPFLQAHLHLGNVDQVAAIMDQIDQPFVVHQSCNTFNAMQEYNLLPASTSAADATRAIVCQSAESGME